jgi:hypothetical protein
MPDDEEEESVVEPPAARALNRGSHDSNYPWAGNWLGCRTECANYAEQQSGQWICSVCTLPNDAGRQFCRSCDSENPRAPRYGLPLSLQEWYASMPDEDEEEENVVEPPAARVLNGGANDPNYPSAGNWLGCRTECANYAERQSGRWICSVCTLPNDAGRQICLSCDTPAGSAAPAVAVAPAVAAPEVAAARAAPAFVFQAPPSAAASESAAVAAPEVARAAPAFVFRAPSPAVTASEPAAAPAFVFQAPFAVASFAGQM